MGGCLGGNKGDVKSGDRCQPGLSPRPKPKQINELRDDLLNKIKDKLKLKNKPQTKKIFKASDHKFKVAAFHQICDGKSNTLVLAVTSNKKYYGGFTPCTWRKGCYYEYEEDKSCLSFLFTFDQDEVKFFDLKKQQKQHAIMNDEDCGPVFGSGYDFYLQDQCNTNKCWNNIGKSYKAPLDYGSEKANLLLNGQQKVTLKEYTIWQITE